MQFRFLTGDINWMQYGGTWISKKLNNGEFDYWLAIRLINWEDACGKDGPKETYNVELLSISPSEAGQENLDAAYHCCGIDGVDHAELRKNPLVQVESLLSYGVYAHLWDANGNNAYKMLKEARHQAKFSQIMYGFMMDRQQNAIGNDGWDFQRGQIGFRTSMA